MNINQIEPFDVAAAIGLDPASAEYYTAKDLLTMQLFVYILGRLVDEDPALQDRIEKYQQEFIAEEKEK